MHSVIEKTFLVSGKQPEDITLKFGVDVLFVLFGRILSKKVST